MRSSEFEVRFPVSGQTVVGSLHVPAGDDGAQYPAVLFCHGFTGTRTESHFLFVKAARAFAACGFVALRIDFRGSGESEGRFQDMTPLTEVADAQAALRFLEKRPEVAATRIGMVGLSLGGLVTALVTAREPVVKAAALWSAVADGCLIWNNRITPEACLDLRRRGWHEKGGHRIGAKFVNLILRLRPAEELKGAAADVLLVHGTNDTTVTLEHPWTYERALWNRRQGSVAVHLVRDADHVFSSEAWETEAIEKTAAWFAERLGSARKKGEAKTCRFKKR
jgi:hypothetical protein